MHFQQEKREREREKLTAGSEILAVWPIVVGEGNGDEFGKYAGDKNATSLYPFYLYTMIKWNVYFPFFFLIPGGIRE